MMSDVNEYVDINGYRVPMPLGNKNSGNSKWGFATKGGKEFFFKELLSPVYPLDETSMSPELLVSRRRSCEEFEVKYVKFYTEINRAGRGGIVRVQDFFRNGSKYYVVTEKINSESIPVSKICTLPTEDILLLICTVADAFASLHSVRIVHSDVKPANIFVKRSRDGKYVGKIIDFDSGFFSYEKMENEELEGDPTYLAPESFLLMLGQDIQVDEKADIFSLGLVFHEYFTGELPKINRSEYDYPAEAVLSEEAPEIDPRIPPEMAKLLSEMIDMQPTNRPSSAQVVARVKEMLGHKVEKVIEEPTFYTKKLDNKIPEKVTKTEAVPVNAWFSRAGDL